MELSRSTAGRFIRVGRVRAQRAAGRVVLGSLVCAAGVMCATSARAGEPQSREPEVSRHEALESHDEQGRTHDVNGNVIRVDEQNFPFGDNDPCINSLVSGLGHFHSEFIDRSTATMFDTEFRIHQNGDGKSAVPGDQAEYRFASWSDDRFRSSTKNFTMTLKTREHIIREDEGLPDLAGHRKDDYFVQTSIKVSGLAPKPVITRSAAESTCK